MFGKNKKIKDLEKKVNTLEKNIEYLISSKSKYKKGDIVKYKKTISTYSLDGITFDYKKIDKTSVISRVELDRYTNSLYYYFENGDSVFEKNIIKKCGC